MPQAKLPRRERAADFRLEGARPHSWEFTRLQEGLEERGFLFEGLRFKRGGTGGTSSPKKVASAQGSRGLPTAAVVWFNCFNGSRPATGRERSPANRHVAATPVAPSPGAVPSRASGQGSVRALSRRRPRPCRARPQSRASVGVLGVRRSDVGTPPAVRRPSVGWCRVRVPSGASATTGLS